MKKKVLTFLEFFFIALTLISLFQLYRIWKSYKEGDAIYNEAKNSYVDGTETEEEKYYFTVDLEGLKEVNPDINGWIRIPDTPVDYPLLVPDNNSYYLKHTYNHAYSDFGSIFVDSGCTFADRNTVIYGHNTKNDSMFGSLKKYKEKAYYDRHPYVYILNGDEEKKYEIIAALTVEVTDPVYTFNTENDNTQKAWLSDLITRSELQTGKKYDFTGEEKTITLSTCTSRTKTERFVVIAQEVDTVWQK